MWWSSCLARQPWTSGASLFSARPWDSARAGGGPIFHNKSLWRWWQVWFWRFCCWWGRSGWREWLDSPSIPRCCSPWWKRRGKWGTLGWSDWTPLFLCLAWQAPGSWRSWLRRDCWSCAIVRAGLERGYFDLGRLACHLIDQNFDYLRVYHQIKSDVLADVLCVDEYV